jgi:hypothetical protein
MLLSKAAVAVSLNVYESYEKMEPVNGLAATSIVRM